MTQQTALDAEAASRAVAGEVRAELARQRRTAVDMAGALGITPHTAGRRLSGESPFTVLEIAKVAAWLGVSVTTLAARAENAGAVAS